MGEEHSVKPTILVFTRYPEPGKAKTRLIPAMGAETAANLQQLMCRGTLSVVGRFAVSGRASCEIHFAGGTREQMASLYGDEFSYVAQSDGDLGDRLQASIARAFANGASSVIVIGTDCPRLADHHLSESLKALESTDVVLGPATDGGYYLIGLRKIQTELFHEIPWSSSNVLSQTIVTANRLGLKVHLLEKLPDVDEPSDLFNLPAELAQLFDLPAHPSNVP
jgi:rSAM/selenodomain-associated transferase 1